MNYCSSKGKANFTTGQCECYRHEGDYAHNFKFADCSVQVINLTADIENYDQTLLGPKWFSMQYEGAYGTSLTITPNVTSDIYILKSAAGDPNDFVYDMSFKNVTSALTLNSYEIGLKSDEGYSVAVYVSAINEGKNELLPGSLGISFVEKNSVALLPTLMAMATTVIISFF